MAYVICHVPRSGLVPPPKLLPPMTRDVLLHSETGFIWREWNSTGKVTKANNKKRLNLKLKLKSSFDSQPLQRRSIPDIAFDSAGVDVLHAQLVDSLDAQETHTGFCFCFEDCSR